jgi:hypothetical protein
MYDNQINLLKTGKQQPVAEERPVGQRPKFPLLVMTGKFAQPLCLYLSPSPLPIRS